MAAAYDCSQGAPGSSAVKRDRSCRRADEHATAISGSAADRKAGSGCSAASMHACSGQRAACSGGRPGGCRPASHGSHLQPKRVDTDTSYAPHCPATHERQSLPAEQTAILTSAQQSAAKRPLRPLEAAPVHRHSLLARARLLTAQRTRAALASAAAAARVPRGPPPVPQRRSHGSSSSP